MWRIPAIFVLSLLNFWVGKAWFHLQNPLPSAMGAAVVAVILFGAILPRGKRP